MVFFLAHDLTPATRAHDLEELIEVHWILFSQALGMVERNDAKTALGLLRVGQTRQAAVLYAV